LRSTNRDRSRAEASFKKAQRFQDGQIATAAYEAEQQAVQQKTARLRALRLARDAAEDASGKGSRLVQRLKEKLDV
jgi:hypothetical protein